MSKLDDELAVLADLSPAQLRDKWHSVEGAAAPSVPPALLRRLTAQRLQERRHGRLPVLYRGLIVHHGEAYPGEHEAIVDEELWDAVQARLASNASGPSRRLRHQHPSLLTGQVFDGDEGRAMSPSHATKSRRRYRYYVTRSDQVDGARAWRLSAHDLGQLVCSNVAERLLDQQFVMGLAGGSTADAEQLQKANAEADMAAATLRSGSGHAKAELLSVLLRQVRLHEDRIEAEIDPTAVRERLVIAGEAGALLEPTIITIPSVRVRRGHQLRLIVPGPEVGRSNPARRDAKLTSIIAEAHQARQLVLANPQHSLAQIAREHGRCRTRLGKLVALSCLAPDIVTAIVQGKQPAHLTASLLTSMPLALSWAEQRRELGLA